MTTVAFEDFVIELEDAANPGTWIRPCGLTSKGLDRSASTVDTPKPDCDDESLPAEILRGIASLDWKLSGAATIKAEDLDMWEDRYEAGQPFNIRVTIDLARAKGGRSYVGPAVIDGINMKVDQGGKAATGDISLAGAGKLVRTKAAA